MSYGEREMFKPKSKQGTAEEKMKSLHKIKKLIYNKLLKITL